MNTITQQFLDELRLKPHVLGIILFGSWARGNHREDSDVDLLVIVQEGFQRTIEVRETQAFEIIFTTAQGAIDFWQSSPDEAVDLWRVAQVVFERDGTIAQLKTAANEIKARGKPGLSDEELSHLVFDVQDQLKAAQVMAKDDPTTARMLLHMKVLQLTEVFFDIRQLWTPPPKQRLAIMREHHPELYDRIVRFYDEPSVIEQIRLVREIADDVVKR